MADFEAGRLVHAACTLALIACGTAASDAPMTDAGADADAAGSCHLDAASCVGDPGCCPPYRATQIDLAHGCGDLTLHVVGCFAPASCPAQIREPSCYVLHSVDPTLPDVTCVSTYDLAQAPGINATPCDADTTNAALAVYAECP